MSDKTVSKEQAVALFADYDKAETKCVNAENAVLAAKEKRSLAVKAIMDAYGHNGPFVYSGRRLTAMQRPSSEEKVKELEAQGKKPIYFFREPQEREATTID